MNVYDAKALGVTTDEIYGVKELKRRLEGQLKPGQKDDDITFLRFLRARDGNITKAENMLRSSLQWREKFDMDNIDLYQSPEVFDKFLPGGVVGFAKSGSVIYYLPVGSVDVGWLKCAKKIDFVKSVMKELERVCKLAKMQGEKLQRDVYQIVAILDFENFSLATSTNRLAIEMGITLLSLYEANYPERLELCIIPNAQYYFTLFYTIVKPFLMEKTINKVKIFGKTGYKEECLRVIDADVLPAFLGGNRYDPPGDPRCTAFLKPGCIVPKSYYLRSSARRLFKQQHVFKMIVPRRSKQALSLEISEPGSRIQWELETEKGDIAFGICSRPFYCNDRRIPTVDNMERIESNIGVESGAYACEKPGKYTLVFDNSYSWIKQKEVYYRIEIVKPDGENYFLTE